MWLIILVRPFSSVYFFTPSLPCPIFPLLRSFLRFHSPISSLLFPFPIYLSFFFAPFHSVPSFPFLFPCLLSTPLISPIYALPSFALSCFFFSLISRLFLISFRGRGGVDQNWSMWAFDINADTKVKWNYLKTAIINNTLCLLYSSYLASSPFAKRLRRVRQSTTLPITLPK